MEEKERKKEKTLKKHQQQQQEHLERGLFWSLPSRNFYCAINTTLFHIISFHAGLFSVLTLCLVVVEEMEEIDEGARRYTGCCVSGMKDQPSVCMLCKRAAAFVEVEDKVLLLRMKKRELVSIKGVM